MLGFGLGKPRTQVKLGESKMSLRYDPVLKRWVAADGSPVGGNAPPPPPPPTSALPRATPSPAPVPAPLSSPPASVSAPVPVAGAASSAVAAALMGPSPLVTPTGSPSPAASAEGLPNAPRGVAGRRGAGARARYVDTMNVGSAAAGSGAAVGAAGPARLPVPLAVRPLQPMLVEVTDADHTQGAAAPAAAAGGDSYVGSYYGAGGTWEAEAHSISQSLLAQADEPAAAG
jgi:hypothetical protein